MRTYLIATLVAVLGAAAPGRGGALPQPRRRAASTRATLFATSGVALPKKVRLVVTKTGTSARVIWWCG